MTAPYRLRRGVRRSPSEPLLQKGQRRAPVQLSVVLRSPVGIPILVAGVVGTVVNVRRLVDAKGLVGEVVSRPTDAASDPRDDRLT